MHARAHLTDIQIGTARIYSLLEQGDTRFLPETFSEQSRRIDGSGEDRAGHGLRDIVHPGEFIRMHL